MQVFDANPTNEKRSIASKWSLTRRIRFVQKIRRRIRPLKHAQTFIIVSENLQAQKRRKMVVLEDQ